MCVILFASALTDVDPNNFGDLLVFYDANDITFEYFDPNDLVTTLPYPNSNVIEWVDFGVRPDYICDANNLPYDISCSYSTDITIEIRPDGNLYLTGGSMEEFIICIYEAMVLDGTRFTGELIIED
jgi:hypothetical protein